MPPAAGAGFAPDTVNVHGVTQAVAVVTPVPDGTAEGTLRLTQTQAGVRVRADLRGLTPRARHGLQILHGRGCEADPAQHLGAATGSVHGTPFRHPPDRHAGDLGNVAADASGRARYDRIDPLLRLDSTRSAVGRAVVVRSRPDDGTTPPDGNAGPVIGCGVFRARP